MGVEIVGVTMLREAAALFLGILTSWIVGFLLNLLIPMLFAYIQAGLMSWFLFIVFTAAVFAGGFVSGRVAKRWPITIGFVVGALFLERFFLASGWAFYSAFEVFAYLFTTVTFGLLGAAAAILGSWNTEAVKR